MTARSKKALFLDRDGVINVDRGHVHREEDFEFTQGIFEVCRAAQDQGYLLVVVTNQAGIARGYYSESTFLHLSNWMVSRFQQNGVQISGLYYCPYHPVFGIGRYRHDSADRKPNPGMLLRAREDLDLDLASSILIGDKLTDIQAAAAAGVGTRLLLSSERPGPEAQAIVSHFSPSLDDLRRRFFTERNCCVSEGELPVGMSALQ
jgi:D-glycero-D-manno-heptose 1,7-bisphosphate phosphatase